MLGWPTMDCIFLGGIIAISSTTIIIRAFDELGVKTRKFASLVYGRSGDRGPHGRFADGVAYPL